MNGISPRNERFALTFPQPANRIYSKVYRVRKREASQHPFDEKIK